MNRPELRELEFRNLDARAWRGELPVGHQYTLGVAGQEFFQRLRDDGVLTGTRCPECRRTYVPPRIYCPDCFTELDEWVEVGPTGTVAAFTTVPVDRRGEDLGETRLLGLVRLDGADGGLLHWLGDCAPEEARIGLRVKVVLRPNKERQGGLDDIRHFAPVKGK